MHSEKRLNQLANSLVLDWWARQPAGQDYAFVVTMVRRHEVRTTVSEVRRDIRRRLYLLKLLPINRPPTNEDYAQAKERWTAMWDDLPIY